MGGWGRRLPGRRSNVGLGSKSGCGDGSEPESKNTLSRNVAGGNSVFRTIFRPGQAVRLRARIRLTIMLYL